MAPDRRMTPRVGTTLAQLGAQGLGVLLLAVGLVLFVAPLRRFALEGRSTLAPWDSPTRLVVRGPSSHVRDPMISGVVCILLAEGLLLLSRPHLVWAGAFLAVDLLYFPLYEEPRLRRRFGEAYREYCRHVPRVVPRLRPWRPPNVTRAA